MKHLTLTVLAIMCTGFSAMAIFNPNWERPLFEAQMTELDATGHEVNQGLEKLLTLHQRDGEDSPTTLSFREETFNICLMLYLPGQTCPLTRKETKVFKIEALRKDDCGAEIYQAREVTNGLSNKGSAVLSLIDYKHDVCEHVVPARWEAKLSVPGQKDRTLRGNPVGVVTVE